VSEYRGALDGSGRRFALVVSRYSRIIAQQLVAGARECLEQHGCDAAKIDVIWVPGSFELPLAVRLAAESGRYDAILGLGCIIRGQTHHNEYIAKEVAGGFGRVSMDTGVPVIFGVITADTLEQAVERAGVKTSGRGWEAAQAGLEMVNLIRSLPRKTKKR
jgi:6,7-dimethyl-8-ribityllumazine synthase